MNHHRVTVGIPLHRSARWFEVVCDTIRALPDEVTEILVSDRTVLDDTATRVREFFDTDPRVKVIAGSDDMHWTNHLQSILDTAHGEYFCWMPHDDSADPTWVPHLAAALDAHPTAWLAYGRLIPVLADGVTPHHTWTPVAPPVGPLSARDVTSLMLEGELGVPFRGLIRRRAVLASGIRLGEMHGSQLADVAWVYRIALRAPVVFIDSTATRKRVHSDGTFIRWERSPGDLERLALALLRDPRPRGLRGATWRARILVATRLAAITRRRERSVDRGTRSR